MRKGLDELAQGKAGSGVIHPQHVARVISELASDDAVFTWDVGTPTAWAVRYLKMNGRRRLLGSFNHGSMANALPQAIGAQAAYPLRQAVTLSGDGGLAMLMGELLSLRQLKLPVKIVVFNNGTLGFVELEMKAAGLIETGVALDNPDFAAMARAIGLIWGSRHRSPGCGGWNARSARPSRAGSAGRRDRSDRTLHAAETHARADEGVQPLHGQSHYQRARRRSDRTRQDQCRTAAAAIPDLTAPQAPMTRPGLSDFLSPLIEAWPTTFHPTTRRGMHHWTKGKRPGVRA